MGDISAAGTDGQSGGDGQGEPEGALTVAHVQPRGTDGGASSDRVPGEWRYELRRWLATLNPGRTGREYEKAVSYFFLTPGVPGGLAELTFDLLLAYRGALALRATPTERGGAYAVRTPVPSAAALGAPVHEAVSGPAAFGGDSGDMHGDDGRDAQTSQQPLAPATVNIRLTALRQFLVHCSMLGVLADLPPDRIRMALKRLQIDRRRPYQVLAESEWEGFLAAAALPAALRHVTAMPGSSSLPESADVELLDVEPDENRSPWGIPRAVRAQTVAKRDSEASVTTGDDSERSAIVRSRAGLTGARTAQRDHALIALALATGLRAIELSLLDLADLTREWHDGQEEWWLVLPDAKTKGQHGGRTLPLAKPLVETLLAYVRSTGRTWEKTQDRATPLFLRVRAKLKEAHSDLARSEVSDRLRLHLSQIRAIIDRAETQWLAARSQADEARGTLAGDTRSISPHALRHSTAIALLQGNAASGRPPASVEHVRGWLGHFDIRTTQGYLSHLESREHRRPYVLPVSPVPNDLVVSDPRETGPARDAEPQSVNDPDDRQSAGD